MRLGLDTNGDGSWEDVFSFGKFPWYVRLGLRLALLALGVILRRRGIVSADKTEEGEGGEQ